MDCLRSYKDKYVRYSIVGWGIFILILLNSTFIIYIFAKKYFFAYFLFLIVFGYIYWSKYKFFSTLKYCLNDKGLYIVYGSKKFMISKEQVEKIEIYKLPHKLIKPWGLKYDFWNKIIYFTTAVTNLVLIKLKNGKKIVISPQKVFLDILKNKLENEK